MWNPAYGPLGWFMCCYREKSYRTVICCAIYKILVWLAACDHNRKMLHFSSLEGIANYETVFVWIPLFITSSWGKTENNWQLFIRSKPPNECLPNLRAFSLLLVQVCYETEFVSSPEQVHWFGLLYCPASVAKRNALIQESIIFFSFMTCASWCKGSEVFLWCYVW